MQTSPKIIDLDFVQIEIHSEFLISTIKEGVVLQRNHLEIFYNLYDEYYPNKKFGYISDRKFDYTVDPTCYLESEKYPNLKGMAVWCHSEASFKTAQFEKTFFKRPFEIFYTIEECKTWLNKLG